MFETTHLGAGSSREEGRTESREMHVPHGEPFEYYGQRNGHPSVTAESIRDAVDVPRSEGERLIQLAQDLRDDSRTVDLSVQGDVLKPLQQAPLSTAEATASVGNSGLFAAGAIDRFSVAVGTFDDHVKALNARAEKRVTELRATLVAPSPNLPSLVPPMSYADAMHKAHGELSGRYNGYLATLQSAIETVCQDLNSPTPARAKALILAGYLPASRAAAYGVTLSAKEMATANTQAYVAKLAQMTHAEQLKYLRTHCPTPQIAAALSPETKRMLGKAMGAELKKPGHLSAVDITLISAFRAQSAFAYGLYSSVTPEEVSDEIKAWQPDIAGNLDTYKRALVGLGATFATYTKGQHEYAPPPNLTNDWFDAITADGGDGQAARLTLMLKAGGSDTSYERGFLSDLTGRVLDWEKHQPPVYGGVGGPDSLWSKMDSLQPTQDPFGPLQPGAGGAGIGPSLATASDGLANLLAAMATSPGAAQDFFLGRYDGAQGTPRERMEYLIGGKDARTFAYPTSDDGDGLGLALQAAVVGEDQRTADGTKVATTLFKTISAHHGDDHRFDRLPGISKLSEPWHVWNGMTDNLGAIASGYTGDLYDLLNNKAAPIGPTHLAIGRADLGRVLGEIGHSEDKTGLQTLTTAMLLETRSKNMDYLNSVKGSDLASIDFKDFTGLNNTHGQVMSRLLLHGLSDSVAMDNTAENRAAIMRGALSLVGGVIPGGSTANHAADWAIDSAKGATIRGLQDSIAASTSSSGFLNEAEASIPEQLKNATIGDLYRAKFLGPQTNPNTGALFSGASEDLFEGNPPSLLRQFTDGNGRSLMDPTPEGTDAHTSDFTKRERDRLSKAYDNLMHGPLEYTLKSLTESNEFIIGLDHPDPMKGAEKPNYEKD